MCFVLAAPHVDLGTLIYHLPLLIYIKSRLLLGGEGSTSYKIVFTR